MRPSCHNDIESGCLLAALWQAAQLQARTALGLSEESAPSHTADAARQGLRSLAGG